MLLMKKSMFYLVEHLRSPLPSNGDNRCPDFPGQHSVVGDGLQTATVDQGFDFCAAGAKVGRISSVAIPSVFSSSNTLFKAVQVFPCFRGLPLIATTFIILTSFYSVSDNSFIAYERTCA
jgi:hypothetical protein